MERKVSWHRVQSSGWLVNLLLCLGMALLLGAGISAQAYGAGGSIIWQAGDVQIGKQIAKASAIDSQGSVVITGYQNLGSYDNY